MKSQDRRPTVPGLGCLVGAFVMSLVATPALARIPMAIPEPSTLSIIGVGVVGMIVAFRISRRK